MNVEDVLERWDEDSKIDPLDLDNELLRLSSLHNRYVRLWAVSKRECRNVEAKLKQLVSLKTDWYDGSLNGTDTLDKLGWEPCLKRVMKPDMPRALEADRDIVRLTEILGESKDCKEVLESILKEIFSRSFNIRGAIEHRRFEAGA